MLTRGLLISTFVLCFGAVRMFELLGEGEAMDEEMMFQCFLHYNCYGGEKRFKETVECYDVFGEEIFMEVFNFLKQAGEEVGEGEKMTLSSSDPYVLREELCPHSIEVQEKVFDAFVVTMVEQFTDICSDKSLEEKCSLYEAGLGCMFNMLEESASNNDCKVDGPFESITRS